MSLTVPQDGGYGWVIVLSSFTIIFLIDGILFSFGLLLNVLVDEFGESTASVAVMGGLLFGCIAISAPLSGSLSDVFGKRYICVAGTIIFALGLFVSSFAPNVRLLYFTYGIVSGTGVGMMFTPSFSSVLEHFDKRRGLAGGIALCASGVGIFVTNICTNLLLQEYGWRGTLLLLSAIMLNGVPCGLVIPQKSRADSIKYVEEESNAGVDEKAESGGICSVCRFLKHVIVTSIWRENIFVFRNIHSLSFLLCALTVGLAFYTPFAFLPKQAIQLGMTENEAAWLTSAIGITNTISRVIIGWLGNRSFINRNILLKVVVLWLALTLFTSLLLTSFKTKLIFALMYGAAYGSFFCTVPLALVDVVGPEHSGKTTGLFVTMMTGANLIGTPLAGWTVDMTGDFVACFMLAGGETLVALAFLMLPQISHVCCTKEPKSQTTHL